jgi:hypothetical protein
MLTGRSPNKGSDGGGVQFAHPFNQATRAVDEEEEAEEETAQPVAA